jgi:hypothetical protein
MDITLASGSPTLLRITWEPYDPKTEAAIHERLQTVPGINGAGRHWYCPAIQMERLMVLFPRASFQYAAYCAADKAARDFFESLRSTGVKLVIDGDKVKATGDNVSPLVAQLVDDRSPALLSFVQLEMDRAAHKQQAPVPATAMDEKLDLLGKGILNAQKRAEIESQYRYGGRKGKKKSQQGSLGL